MPAHRMGNDYMRRRGASLPIRKKAGEIVNPIAIIIDMTNRGIVRKSPRTALPAPIHALHLPAGKAPILETFEIFLEMVTSTAEKQQ